MDYNPSLILRSCFDTGKFLRGEISEAREYTIFPHKGSGNGLYLVVVSDIEYRLAEKKEYFQERQREERLSWNVFTTKKCLRDVYTKKNLKL